MEALLNLGQNRYALTHYKYYTSKMYALFKEKPSDNMKNIYRNIKSNQDRESENINLDNLDIQLKDTDESQGALRCDNHYFKFIYNLELRNAKRSKNSVYVGIISIDKLGYRQLSEERLKDAMNPLLDIVYHKLRKGDVLTQWNDSQVLLLLYDLEEKYIEPVIKRVKDGFKEIIKDESIILNIKFKKI